MATLSRRQFLATTAAFTTASAQSARLPNFVILFADDMGYGDLACYGHPTLKTPNLDRLAAEGMRLTSFYAAASVCTPSRVGLLTGRYPMRAGQPNNFGPDSVGGLRASEILIAQHLKKKGYKTMAIGKWHLGHRPAEFLPTSRGFDAFFGLPYSNDMIRPWVQTEQPLYLYRDSKPIDAPVEQPTLTERYTDEAVKFIRANRANPFFLYLPYAMPHLPISVPERFKGRSRAGLYGDVIETLDWSAGQILKTLKELNLDSNTLVMFASDNGPWHDLPPRMLQKGNERWHTGTKGLLRGHKGTTYDGGHRVPGIFRWPGRIPAGQVHADMASTLDVFPTIAEAAGIPMPSDRVYDGSSLLPFLTGKASNSPRKDYFYFLGKNLHAVREGSLKLRYTADAGTELFDLDVDPAESYNIADLHKQAATRMLAKLRAMGKEVGADMAP